MPCTQVSIGPLGWIGSQTQKYQQVSKSECEIPGWNTSISLAAQLGNFSWKHQHDKKPVNFTMYTCYRTHPPHQEDQVHPAFHVPTVQSVEWTVNVNHGEHRVNI
jgi:hypothetical protein